MEKLLTRLWIASTAAVNVHERLPSRRVGLEPRGDAGGSVAVEGAIKLFRHVADVWRRKQIVQRSERVIGGQGGCTEHGDGRTRYRAGLQRLDQRRLINNRTARRIDQPRRRLHQGELGRPDQASGAAAQDEMDRDDIRLAEQCLLVYESGAGSARLRLGQVLAPGDHLHPEGDTDARDLSSDVAQPDDRETFASQV